MNIICNNIMFTTSKLINMNNDKNYSSYSWIKNINNLDDNKLYNIYPTNNSSLRGREYIAIPSDISLSPQDYNKYNIMK